LQACRKQEDFKVRVGDCTKTLDDELKLFRAEKEQEMRVLLSEFVRLQKTTNDLMKGNWALFLVKAE